MKFVALAVSRRYIALSLAIACMVVALPLAPTSWFWAAVLAVAGVLVAVGLHDLRQTRHSVLRTYPIIAHLRFLLEDMRAEIRQYFFESDTEGVPFSRNKRAIVYQRAKGDLDKRPFGTLLDVYATSFEWLNHSVVPAEPTAAPFRITIGGPDCRQPYSASVLNISAMSFGALSANAIRSLNKGAKLGQFAHDTGEGPGSKFIRTRHLFASSQF